MFSKRSKTPDLNVEESLSGALRSYTSSPRPNATVSLASLSTRQESIEEPYRLFSDLKIASHHSDCVEAVQKSASAEMTSDAPRTTARRPLNLLDLPMDILKDIVKEVTHTNDLVSLALTHSALHRIVIPSIYSRFDIVWPDTLPCEEPRSGVDALTYGLATLVMGGEVFGGPPPQHLADGQAQLSEACQHCGQKGKSTFEGFPAVPHWEPRAPRVRGGNYYAQHTRHFSIGNGLSDWVADYLISKESGKMLGTLVALAVARMLNLESFVWDMPTGVLRDVWLVLSSLGDRQNGQQCRLRKVWIRWHDSSQTGSSDNARCPRPDRALARQLLGPSTSTGILICQEEMGSLEADNASSAKCPDIFSSVEHPTFSILPALQSLSVLDIDKLEYLDEMSVLIGRSRSCLRELRVGIASHVRSTAWVVSWDGAHLRQVRPTSGGVPAPISDRRLGGVLGVLLGRVYDLHHATGPEDALDGQSIARGGLASGDPALVVRDAPGQLRLEVLELERVTLCIPLMHKAFDWTVMTRLVLLNCSNTELLWKTLRKHFTPRPVVSRTHIAPRSTCQSVDLEAKVAYVRPQASEYQLKLREVHTDAVSSSLIAFLRDTLCPNSLEVLILQEGSLCVTTVPIESIYVGVLKRHRGSLRKLLIDSRGRNVSGQTVKGPEWRRWMFNKEVLDFVASGKMDNLRELGMALEYKEWHPFLQRLPRLPRLHSLYVTHVADHVHASNLDPKELALQIVDIVALRPEIDMTYVGISSKCFEIMETRTPRTRQPDPEDTVPVHLSGPSEAPQNGRENDEPGAGFPDEGEESMTADHLGSATDLDDVHAFLDGTDDDDDGDVPYIEEETRTRLKLREILFYDDKIAIFKARHGRI